MNLNSIQTFFNNYPVVSGIILFFVISFIVLLVWLVTFLFSKKLKKDKKQKTKNFNINNSVEVQEVSNDKNTIEKGYVPLEKKEFSFEKNITYFQIDFGKSGKLILKDITNKTIKENPEKSDFINIFKNSNSKLYLPENYVEILSNDSIDKFSTSTIIKSNNLFVFNSFIHLMNKSVAPWAISKFKVY